MTVPAELIDRSCYTVIIGIRIAYIGENEEKGLLPALLSRSRVLQFAVEYEKIHIGPEHIEITYTRACYLAGN